jgi:hypothetical protein
MDPQRGGLLWWHRLVPPRRTFLHGFGLGEDLRGGHTSAVRLERITDQLDWLFQYVVAKLAFGGLAGWREPRDLSEQLAAL